MLICLEKEITPELIDALGEANLLQVKMELQADCFAGVWANNANRSRQILEQGDIEKGLNAAAAIGDDRLQRQSRGYVVPDAFNLVQLILHFAVVMVGGIGSLMGPVIGALALTAAPELFRDFPGFEELFLAILIALILLFLPRGLVSLVARRERYWRE